MSVVQGILLAAGLGRRFDPDGGRDKLLTPLADGRPVLWHSASALISVLPGAIAVVRPEHQERMALLRALGLTIVDSAAAEAGMGAALAAGVMASDAGQAHLVALADMPWIRPDTIRSVVTALGDAQSVVAPVHQGRRGHPVAFGAAWTPALRTLDGDVGARDLIARATLTAVTVDDAGVLRDVDRPADLSA